MSKNFVLTADFETFKAKIANADQVKEERNEVFKQLRSSAQKAQDLETVLANFGNEISELTHELRKKALFAEVQVLERKVDKLPTFSNLHNIEKMFADYTACQPFDLFKDKAESQIKDIEETLLTLVTSKHLQKEVKSINQVVSESFG